MKKLDRYVAKNFLIGYCIAFAVLMGLRVITDLFVHLDEFTEHETLTTMDVMKNIFTFYYLNSLLYFRDFAGMITVVAAAFSFGKMIRSNELIAVMASGVSLKRIICPIIFLALLLTGLLVIDQELLIPHFADKLVRSHDDLPGQETYDVRFISDGNGSLIFSQRYDVKTATLFNPTIILRQLNPETGIWNYAGRINAEKATYDNNCQLEELKGLKGWDLYRTDPNTGQKIPYGVLWSKNPNQKPQVKTFYQSDLKPKDIPIRRKSEFKALLSMRQLIDLTAQSSKIRDRAQLYSQKHFRITEPIINLVMLMICLPILVCRDPKSMKSAVMISFAVTSACFVTTFVCKMLATEQIVFNKVMPEFWAWLPV
ncbi:MAG: LptF/LptG family permease, partial [Sedimentisphaerales bacterium]|nr:LptF/LptG family permease [Sedimentisphaerales bacterium]